MTRTVPPIKGAAAKENRLPACESVGDPALNDVLQTAAFPDSRPPKVSVAGESLHTTQRPLGVESAPAPVVLMKFRPAMRSASPVAPALTAPATVTSFAPSFSRNAPVALLAFSVTALLLFT